MRSTGSGALKVKPAKSTASARGASRAGGRRTRLSILHAAKRVLASEGYARFTLRCVAREANLTVGNLAYHYPSKRELVRALIQLLMADYREQVEKQLHATARRSPNAFRSLVRWLMRDSASAQTSRLFREFWTIALHDPFIAQTVDSFYLEVQKTMATRLRQHFPHLPASAARAIVQLMGIISEGSNVLYATARTPTAPMGRVSKLACSLLIRAAQGED